ncbi:MAG: winged helix-turn-helix domain-containing protein [Lachnospiraceae bacterium]|nr:winged helix-turn-helix domain-containing protein [Lachnospiraceae bacterium]
MKNNNEYASLSTSLAKFLSEKLLGSNIEGAMELSNRLLDLESGKTASLTLEIENNDNKGTYADSICYEEMEIIPKFRRVTISGEEIMLTPKEYNILYFLASNRGEIFTKEQIYRAVWEDEYLLDDSNIMAFIRKLRKKIEPNPDAPKFILTVWGIGYKFSDK